LLLEFTNLWREYSCEKSEVFIEVHEHSPILSTTLAGLAHLLPFMKQTDKAKAETAFIPANTAAN